jgi:hypothetical protein
MPSRKCSVTHPLASIALAGKQILSEFGLIEMTPNGVRPEPWAYGSAGLALRLRRGILVVVSTQPVFGLASFPARHRTLERCHGSGVAALKLRGIETRNL